MATSSIAGSVRPSAASIRPAAALARFRPLRLEDAPGSLRRDTG